MQTRQLFQHLQFKEYVARARESATSKIAYKFAYDEPAVQISQIKNV